TEKQSSPRGGSERGMVNGIHHVTHYTGSDFDCRAFFEKNSLKK
ncbi:unnamed protein product, partial [marine sediment metagenome]